MYKKGLIPLTPEKLINKAFTSKAVSAFETLVQACPGFYGEGNRLRRQSTAERVEFLQRLAEAGKNKRRPKPNAKPRKALVPRRKP
ncbi:MAG: hypothetical protein ABH986_01910 [archaeon]